MTTAAKNTDDGAEASSKETQVKSAKSAVGSLNESIRTQQMVATKTQVLLSAQAATMLSLCSPVAVAEHLRTEGLGEGFFDWLESEMKQPTEPKQPEKVEKDYLNVHIRYLCGCEKNELPAPNICPEHGEWIDDKNSW